MNRNIKKAILFIGLTFCVSWLMAILFFAFGGKWNTFAWKVMGIFYMFIPMIITIIIQKCVYREPLKQPLGISFKLNRWFIIAWLLPAIIAFAALAISLCFPGVEYSPGMDGLFETLEPVVTANQLQQMKEQVGAWPIHPVWIALFLGLYAGPTVGAVAGFGEELGWRGFLQKQFAHLSFWKSSLLIGVIWGVWHAPLILQGHNYPKHPKAGVALMILICVLLSPIFSYIRLKARSVIAAAILHGSFNSFVGLPFMLKGGNDLIVGWTGIAGVITLAVVNVILLLYDRFLAKEAIMAPNLR